MNKPRKRPAFKKILLLFLISISIIVLSLYLRVNQLGSKDVWLDEANTVLISEKNLPDISSRLKLDSSPPLFYLILHCWIKFFGQTEAALRTLSAVFGILLVLILFVVGSKLFKTEVGIYSALVAAVSPIQVMYSQEVRMYTLLPLTSILSMYFFIQFIQGNKKTYIFWYTITTIACLYTHNYALFLLPTQVLMLFFFKTPRRTLQTYLISIGCIVLAYLFWLPIFLSQLKNATHYAWIRYFWDKYGFWGSLFQSLKSLSPGGPQLGYVALNGLEWNPYLPVIFISILLSFYIIHVIIKKQTNFCWLFMYLLTPLIIAGLLSTVFSPVYLAGRGDQLIFPAFCLLVGVSISTIKPRRLKYLVIIILIVFSLKTLTDYYRINLKYGDRELATAIRKNMQPGDAILFTSLTRAPLEYYLRKDKTRINLFSYPREMADHLGNQDIVSLLKDPERLIKEAEFLEKEIRESGSQSGRLFIIYVPNPVNEFLKGHFRENMPASRIKSIGKFHQSLLNVPVEVLLINFESSDLN